MSEDGQKIKGHFVRRSGDDEDLSLSTKIWEVDADKMPAKIAEPAVEKEVVVQPKNVIKHKHGVTKYFLYGAMVLGILVVVIVLGLLFLISNNPTLVNKDKKNDVIAIENLQGDDVLDLETDSDQDSIPDDVESALGYDPNSNDCVREIGCGDYTNVPRAKLRLNLVFVLDASGSMNGDINGVNKWRSAVDALKSVLSRGFPSYTDVGLVVYGHKGNSSQEARSVSCNGVEVVSELSPLRTKNVGESVDKLVPSGWTPLAGGLARAGEMLKDREGEGNFVILLSDGLETCDGDPVEQARMLKESGVELTTNVVGLAVNDQEKQQLMEIAQAGGGSYYPADDPKDLERALVLSSEVIRLWEQINQCIIDNLVSYSSCVGTEYLKSINYVKDARLKLQNEVAPRSSGVGVLDVETYLEREQKMWSTYQSLKDDNWGQYQSDLDQLKIGD